MLDLHRWGYGGSCLEIDGAVISFQTFERFFTGPESNCKTVLVNLLLPFQLKLVQVVKLLFVVLHGVDLALDVSYLSLKVLQNYFVCHIVFL